MTPQRCSPTTEKEMQKDDPYERMRELIEEVLDGPRDEAVKFIETFLQVLNEHLLELEER